MAVLSAVAALTVTVLALGAESVTTKRATPDGSFSATDGSDTFRVGLALASWIVAVRVAGLPTVALPALTRWRENVSSGSSKGS